MPASGDANRSRSASSKIGTKAKGAFSPGRLTSRSLIERVATEIGMRILDGTYQPGATIPSEMGLCAELGVSRTALREAIKLVSSKGLVTPRVKVGTIVNPRRYWNFFDPAVLEWLLEVGDMGPFLKKLWGLRTTIEPVAAALAATNATFEDFQALNSSLEAMANAGDDLDAWVAADLRFHQAIYDATGNEFFWPVGRLLKPAFAAGLRVAGGGPHETCMPEHREVHDAIIARDPTRAHRAVETMMRTSETHLSQRLVAEAD